MRRPPRPTRHYSWSTVGMMGSIPQSPAKSRPRSRNTGFPEPFCGHRNTTLPHPEADLSPNACISADDVSVGKVLHRSRRSFLAKHKRTISHGKLLPEMEHSVYSEVVIESDGESMGHDKHSPDSSANSPSLDGPSGRNSASTFNGDDDNSLLPPEIQKRRTVLQRLGLHK